jgi:molecular chaperone GrpE
MINMDDQQNMQGQPVAGQPAQAAQPAQQPQVEQAQAQAQAAPQVDVAALQAELEQYRAGWQRAQADYQNLLAETERKNREWAALSTWRVIEAFLPVYSNFYAAAAHTPEDAGGWENWAKGVLFIQKQFKDILSDHGVTEMNPVGELFDIHRHEAVGEEHSDEYDDGHVIRQVDIGYEMNGKVLRPARVVVCKKDS